MKRKVITILLLLGLLGYTVYEMLRYEQSIRSEKIIKEYIEDDSGPLVEQPYAEDLEQLAGKVNYYFQTSGDVFQALQISNANKTLEWDTFMMKGVNLGVALPGKFPAEFSMSMDEYFEWLVLIGKMNANTIRTYTILPPEFYKAFAKYNLIHEDKPIYLVQGVWARVPASHNYLDELYSRDIQREIVDVIDVLHGNAVLSPERGKAHGVYSADVSQYVSAILFGREWEPDGVFKTNQSSELKRFQGNFIGVHNATPMEVWLAKMMDFLILYETMTYSMQHPISFVNWLPLDPLFHNTEFIENEKVREYDNDLESIDFMKFHASPFFFPGIFASYHAYPYYPDFVYLKSEYAEYIDEKGKRNNYAGYLNELKSHHQGMPLIIAEYGLPSSRGNSHQTPFGLDQGGHDELSHAQKNSRLTEDIFQSGCAGAIYFEWADEWFKHNWLVMDFEVPFEHRKLWHNMENPEQNFGVLAMESRKKILDGSIDDWDLSALQEQAIYTSSDPSYFNIMFQSRDLDLEHQNLYFAIDVVPGAQGDHRLPFSNERFENGFEFLIEVKGKDSAQILVDEPYTIYTDIYNDRIPGYRSMPNENGVFIKQELLTNRGRASILGQHYDSIVFNRSHLLFGNSKTAKNSNADWYYNDSTGILEMRLTWHLLNVTDPSTGCVLDNKIQTQEIECTPTSGIYVKAFVTDSNNKVTAQIPESDLHFHKWRNWTQPKYQQRMKPLYDSLQACFKSIDYQPQPGQQQSRGDEKIQVCNYYQDLSGAATLRFEKGLHSQFEHAYPILNKYKVNATFNLGKEIDDEAANTISSSEQRRNRLGRDEITELEKDGHEVKRAESLQSASMIPAFDLSTMALEDVLEENENKWIILQYEGLIKKPVMNRKDERTDVRQISSNEFEKQLRLIRNSNFWITSESNLLNYENQRRWTEVETSGYRQLEFVKLNLASKEVDDKHPLSFYFYTEAPKVEVSGSVDDGFYENRTGRILLNAIPDRELTIRKIW